MKTEHFISSLQVEPRKKKSLYPEQFQSVVAGRTKRQLGDHFGISKFGVNFTILEPGSCSALLHRHSKQEEFIYVLKGEPTLYTDQGKQQLKAGDCAGFTPSGAAHRLCNHTTHEVHYLEVGDREAGDEVDYPEDDLQARYRADVGWVFTRKDGSSY